MKSESQPTLTLRPATSALDFSAIAAALRKEDAHEISMAAGRVPIATRLRENVELSTVSYVATSGDQSVILGGIAVRQNFAAVWAVGTPLVSRHIRDIAAQTKPMIASWFEMFPEVLLMGNFSLASNTLHHRWLKWAGATMLPEIPLGPSGAYYVPFYFAREGYHVS